MVSPADSRMLLGAVAVTFLAAGAVLWLMLRARRRSGWARADGSSVSRRGVTLSCTVCQRDLVIEAAQLVRLSPPELALAVRAVPQLVGAVLAEYVCPHCEAAHCFRVSGRRIEWVGVNLYEPQLKTTRCFECHRPLRRPPWPEGYYDERLAEVPVLAPDYGLVCRRCFAVCCVECCQKTTRNRTPDGAFVCPRCARYPVEHVFHF